LMRLFGSDRVQPLIEKLGMEEGEAIEYGLLSKQIENAQKRVESRNFDIRKHVLQYDDVMNQQRTVIYAQRREVLEGEDMAARVAEMRRALIAESVQRLTNGSSNVHEWNIGELAEYLEHICLKMGEVQRAAEAANGDPARLEQLLLESSESFYREREDMIARAGIDMREFERVALLGAVDRRWMDHIDAMDQLRDGIGLRAYGQRDPVVEYKMEGYDMFDEMIRLIQEDTLRRLNMAVLVRPPERKEVATQVTATHGGGDDTVVKRPVVAGEKVGRNAPCPCGSGKKYKECCGRK
ncbi:MAG: SEC-C metal-binding domain-containing protein, partial [Christensenellaceae bacterium]|nr:SEC-C metal-binding domain-containing protein [Christensenellaceae bacterium]